MKSTLLQNAIFFVLLGNAMLPALTSAGQYSVQLNEDKEQLTVKASNVPLQTLLKNIAQKSGIAIRFYLPALEIVSVDIEKIPYRKGLELLVKNYNYALNYERNSNDQQLEVSSLSIFSKTNKNRSTIKWSAATIDATSNQSPIDTIFIPEFEKDVRGIHLQSKIPSDRDPLYSMNAHDPLAPFTQENPFPLPGNAMPPTPSKPSKPNIFFHTSLK